MDGRRRRIMAAVMGGAAPSPLLTGLISYWKMNEASGDRSDSLGINLLTDKNTVGSAAGILGNGADLENGSSEYFENKTPVGLEIGDFDFTIALWLRFESHNATRTIIQYGLESTGNKYSINHTATRLQFWIINNSSAAKTAVANNLGDLQDATWYFVVAWHDTSTDKIYLQVNNGTADNADVVGTPKTGTSEFHIGTYFTATNTPGAYYYDGIIDEVGRWNRLLTDAEKTSLYNGGAGIPYPFSSAVTPSLVVYDGDSLTLSAYATAGATYPEVCTALLPGLWRQYNFGASSQVATDIIADAATQIDPLYSTAFTKNVCVCWIGANDIMTADLAGTIYDNIVAYCTARRAAGYKVIVCTVIDRASAPGAKRLAVNASIVASWSTFSDGLADLAASEFLDDDTDVTYYHADGVHLTDAGYAVVAVIVAAAINGL